MTAFTRTAKITACLMLTVASAAACSSSGSSTGSPGSSGSSGGKSNGGKQTVGALRIGDNSSQVLYDTAFAAQAQKYGWNVLPAQSSNSSAGTQLSQLHAMVDQGANGIIVDATDAHAIVPGLTYAASKGTKVVAIDNIPSSGPVYVSVTVDQEAMATLACNAIGKAIGGKGTVIAVEGDQQDSAGLGRKEGLTNCMSSKYPGVKIVEVYGKWDPSIESSQLQTALTQNPHPAAIFMASDTAYLESVLQVMSGKGLTAKVGQPGHVYVSTIDGTPQALADIKSGVIDSSVSQPIAQTGVIGAQYLKDAFDGKKLSVGKTDHGSVIKQENGYLVDVLPATLVTKDNVNSK